MLLPEGAGDPVICSACPACSCRPGESGDSNCRSQHPAFRGFFFKSRLFVNKSKKKDGRPACGNGSHPIRQRRRRGWVPLLWAESSLPSCPLPSFSALFVDSLVTVLILSTFFSLGFTLLSEVLSGGTQWMRGLGEIGLLQLHVYLHRSSLA